MVQPNLPKQLIIPLLIQEKLMVPPQRRVRLPMLIEIGCVMPRTMLTVQEQNHAFADIYETANWTAASVGIWLVYLLVCEGM